MNWVTVKKFSQLCGYSEYTIRAKIKKGQWMIDQHFPSSKKAQELAGSQAWLYQQNKSPHRT